MRINHNIMALNTYRQLTNNTENQGKSIEKLSSGLRINRAGDDAAGLAISEKMRGQISGLNQASMNAQNGISLIQTAEGALNETQSILQRMRELATQSAADTNTQSDRQNLQKEVDQLSQEITRIANTTEFNTQKLLNGGIKTGAIGTDTFQIGANAGQTMTIDINAMDAQSLGVARSALGATVTGTNGAGVTSLQADNGINNKLTNGNYQLIATLNASGAYTTASGLSNSAGLAASTVSGAVTGSATTNTTLTLTYNGGANSGTAASGTLTTVAGASGVLTFSSGATGYTASGTYTLQFSGSGGAVAGQATIVNVLDANNNVVGSAAVTVSGAFTVTFSGVTISGASNSNSGYGVGDKETVVVTAAKADTWTVGGSTTATLTVGSGGTNYGVQTTSTVNVNGLSFTAFSGTAGQAVGDTYTITGYGGATANLQLQTTGGVNIGSSVLADKTNGGTYQVGNNTTGQLLVTFAANAAASGTSAISVNANTSSAATFTNGTKTADAIAAGGIDISSQASASSAITLIDNAIQTVSNERAKLGAFQNRLEHTINNLGTAGENITSSESRIRDVDMAKEMMNQTKNSILAQAAQSMLAQANQVPQGVLQLLKG